MKTEQGQEAENFRENYFFDFVRETGLTDLPLGRGKNIQGPI